MDEIKNKIDFYSNLQPNITSPNDLIQQASLFFDKRRYTIKAVDVCIAATANALQMNLYIYEKFGNKAVIIQQLSAFKETRNGIFLRYQCAPDGNDSIAHYDAIVDIGHVPCSQGQIAKGPSPVNGITQFEVPKSTQLSNSDVQIAEVPENDDDQEERWITPPLSGAHHKRIKSAN